MKQSCVDIDSIIVSFGCSCAVRCKKNRTKLGNEQFCDFGLLIIAILHSIHQYKNCIAKKLFYMYNMDVASTDVASNRCHVGSLILRLHPSIDWLQLHHCGTNPTCPFLKEESAPRTVTYAKGILFGSNRYKRVCRFVGWV